MAKELYSNAGNGYVASPIAASDTTISITGVNFPTTGQFTIQIDGEYLLVTAVSGSSFTVFRGQEGSTAAAHNQYALVYVTLTDGSLRRLCVQSTNGNIISTRRQLNFLGNNVTLTDDPTNDKVDVTISTGSIYTPPPTTGWTLLPPSDTQTATYSTDPAGVTINEAGTNGSNTENVRMLYRAIPSAPFNITAFFYHTGPWNISNSNAGLMLRESATGKLQGYGVLNSSNALQLYALTWNGPNTYNSNLGNGTIPTIFLYLRISYDGTTIKFLYSTDGINFVPMYTGSKTTFFTTAPDQIGFYLNAKNGSGPAACRCVHWSQS